MNAPAPKFRPAAGAPLEIDDETLNEINDELGVPTLVKPENKPSEPPAPAPHTEPEKTAKEKPATVSAPTLAGARKKRTTSQQRRTHHLSRWRVARDTFRQRPKQPKRHVSFCARNQLSAEFFNLF
jgi:hypothetical protein